MTTRTNPSNAYSAARDQYAQYGVDAESALGTLSSVSLSLNCWQGDDVVGFESTDVHGGGGIQATGNYPGRARTPVELRSDIEQALALIPGRHRVNLHAMYGDFRTRPADRDAISSEHFSEWIDWAKNRSLPLDFNATCFAHPKAASGFTLSSRDESIRNFWIEHVKRAREISAAIGRALGSPCIHNLWIPDGAKDQCVDRFGYRSLLRQSLDAVYEAPMNPAEMKDAIESKLFGIGSESFVVGSYDFYLPYALSKGLIPCLDMGHYHPTESVADKVSSLLQYTDELLFHVSRGVRWDSDHVVILNDDLSALTDEIVRAGALEKMHFALDFFDASINRIGAWVVGTRATQKSLLRSLLEPRARLLEYEQSENYFGRLALLEESKSMPFGAVWNEFCKRMDVPAGADWMSEIEDYEKTVTSKR
ncbi:MAG TPA: L-rhamnose isomerase [Bacteroidota bacterium]|nr:L-rhamnose isomerase [Bacteroidota bacterium]